MSAQFEEIVVAADLFKLEQFSPEGGQGFFRLALRRLILTCAISIALRHRQRFAVQLAVGGQRQRFQRHESRGHHVLGQRLGQVRAQAVHRHFGVAGVVGHQAFVARDVLAGQHGRFPYSRVFGQPGFDLARFDAEAADLDLMVIAAQIVDVAIRTPTAQITRFVKLSPGLVDERIGDETLGGQFRPVQVALRHARSTDVDFAGHANRHRLPLRVQDIDLGIRDRTADGNALGLLGDGFN